MEYIIVVFRSRTQTGIFADAMQKNGRYCSVVQTPSVAKVGCGVSARIFLSDYRFADRLISQKGLNGFEGFYLAKAVGSSTTYKKL